MSIKSLLLPAFSERLLSRQRLLQQRAEVERRRIRAGERHDVHYFHQVDDPYSALAAASLAPLLARYDIDIVAHVVNPPADDAAPERAQLVAYSRRDAQLLARHRGLSFHDHGMQPSPQAVELIAGLLVAAIDAGRFVELAGPLSAGLWHDDAVLLEQVRAGAPLQAAEGRAVHSHRQASTALRQRLGHYLGATFYYRGEWYWGIDRLYHLELRLQQLGAQRPGVDDLMFPPDADLQQSLPIVQAAPIDFFFSLRSPYSAIVAPRVFQLGQRTGATVRLRFVLPMVMRGLAVPRNKRSHIIHDAAREAFVRDLPFGRLNDPIGRPTERGLAIMAFAERAGKGQAYLTSFMRGVWAEGLDAGSARGLRKIVERAGLDWDQASLALKDQSWRITAEQNRQELSGLGLWGVPSFRVGNTAVWGQDRLWAVQEALLALPVAASADLALPL